MNTSAAEARKAYKREWAKKHPDKIREYQRRYWTKKGAEAAASEAARSSRSDTEQEEGAKK